MKVFTVVIAEQEHLDVIQEYKTFLKPFLTKPDLAFCRWRPDADTLEEAVPELRETVARTLEWRMIVLCDETGLTEKNPFNVVKFQSPPMPEDREKTRRELVAEYMPLVQKAKFEAYEQAAKQPLTKLVTWLCESPTVTKGRNRFQEDDPEFAEYLAESEYKETLRDAIRGPLPLEIHYPTEILCLAKRCYNDPDYDLKVTWNPGDDLLYSRFNDWNLYFEKMRFLVFDILPKTHQNYSFDYLRFLYTMLLLANFQMPQSSLNPKWVYALQCENDEAALRQLVGRFDAKLAMTQDMLKDKIRVLQSKPKVRLSDQEAESIFCGEVTVSVTVPNDVKSTDLYVSTKDLGLSRDCPEDEMNGWNNKYKKSRTALTRFLKQPRRALKRSASDLRRIWAIDLGSAHLLNEFQLEDVELHVGEEELKMVNTPTCDLYNMERYTQQLEDEDKAVRATTRTRMSRKATLGVCASVLLLALISYLPLLLSNASTDKSKMFSLIIMGAGTFLFAAIGIGGLLYLRHILRKSYGRYNHVMSDVEAEVNDSMSQFSKYMSHAANVMRGYSVMNYCAETENPDELTQRIYQKHIVDLDRARSELREVFGQFLVDDGTVDLSNVEPYAFDYNRHVDFQYPIYFTADQYGHIDYIQRGNEIEVPVNFVKSVRVRREALYD